MDVVDDDALQAICPVLRALALAIVIRVFVFAVEIHVCVLLDMVYEARRDCVRRVLNRISLYVNKD